MLPEIKSISAAQRELSKIVNSGQRYLILNNSQPVAAIISFEDFERFLKFDEIEVELKED